MTVPVWMLLGFATWTALLLLFTVGIYRWSRIFCRTGADTQFPGRRRRGRGMVSARDTGSRELHRKPSGFRRDRLWTSGCQRDGNMGGRARGGGSDRPDLPVAGARMFRHTNTVAAVRFAFFFVQFVCFFWLIGIIAAAHTGSA